VIAPQPNVFSTGILVQRSLFTSKGRSAFPCANHCQGQLQTPQPLSQWLRLTILYHTKVPYYKQPNKNYMLRKLPHNLECHESYKSDCSSRTDDTQNVTCNKDGTEQKIIQYSIMLCLCTHSLALPQNILVINTCIYGKYS
jgi:hypothetical protein